MKAINKICDIQGEIKVQLVITGLNQKVAHKLAGDFVQMWLDSGLLSKEAQKEVDDVAEKGFSGK